MTSEFPPQPGGIGNHSYHLASQLYKNGYEVLVIADQRSEKGDEEEVFDAFLSFEVKRIALTRPRILMYFYRVWALFKHLKQSHHVMATGKFPLWSVALGSLFFKRNYLAVIHGTEVNFKPYLLRHSITRSLKQFDTIVAVSNYTNTLVAPMKTPIEVIPNGVDASDQRLELEIRAKKLKGHPILTTVGNVTARKGQQHVIAHLPSLVKQFPELHYHCIGLTTEVPQALKLAKDLNVEANVTFHGRVSDAELHHFLSETDIFVMLSSETVTGDVEGFGIAILEANVFGVPAIGAKGCGIEDAIANGVSGLLVDPLDADAFLEAIQEIIANKKTYRNEALSWAKQHDWATIIHQYIALLK